MFRPLYRLLDPPPPRRCPVSGCDRVAGDEHYQCERCDMLDSIIAELRGMGDTVTTSQALLAREQ